MTDEVTTLPAPAEPAQTPVEAVPTPAKEESTVDHITDAVKDAVQVYDNRSLFQKEPAVVIGAVASLIVALAAIFGLVIDVNALTGVLVSVVPIVTALLVRAHVIPAA